MLTLKETASDDFLTVAPHCFTSPSQDNFQFETLSLQADPEQLKVLAQVPTALIADGVNWARHLSPLVDDQGSSNDSVRAQLAATFGYETLQLLPQGSTAGCRIAFFTKLLLRTLAVVEDLELTVADLFEYLSHVVDFLSPVDAAIVVDVLETDVDLLRECMSQSHKIKSNLLVSRARAISVVSRIKCILDRSTTLVKWGAKARFILFACLPASFDGIANRARGKESPNIIKCCPSEPVTHVQEKQIRAAWKAMCEAELRMSVAGQVIVAADGALIIPATPKSSSASNSDDVHLRVTCEDYILAVNVWRFLQDPSEYLARCIQNGPDAVNKQAVALDDDDEKEEGEEEEENEEKVAKRRQKSAQKHMSALGIHDVLSCKLRDIARFLQFLRQAQKACSQIPHHRKMKLDGSMKLWTSFFQSPLAFYHTLKTTPEALAAIAATVALCCKMHFEWPSRSGENCLLTRWVEKVNPGVVIQYRQVLICASETMETFYKPSALQRILRFEAADFAMKTEGFELPHLPEDDAMEDQPTHFSESSFPPSDADLLDKRRLGRFHETALPMIDMVTRAADSVTMGLAPLRMTQLRDSIYSTDPLPENFESFTLPAKINQRRIDYNAKIQEDENPENEIEEQERLLSQHFQQWRVFRSIAHSGYPLKPTHGGEGKAIRYYVNLAAAEVSPST